MWGGRGAHTDKIIQARAPALPRKPGQHHAPPHGADGEPQNGTQREGQAAVPRARGPPPRCCILESSCRTWLHFRDRRASRPRARWANRCRAGGLAPSPPRLGFPSVTHKQSPQTHLLFPVPGRALPLAVQHEGRGAGRSAALSASLCGNKTTVVSIASVPSLWKTKQGQKVALEIQRGSPRRASHSKVARSQALTVVLGLSPSQDTELLCQCLLSPGTSLSPAGHSRRTRPQGLWLDSHKLSHGRAP